MSSNENQLGRILVVNADQPTNDQTITVAKAIASQPRLRILNYLGPKVASLSEISEDLEMPIATASLHLKNLEEAGLISSHTTPGKRGQQRIYTRILDVLVFHLPEHLSRNYFQSFTVQMPVGGFVAHSVVPTCGLAGADAVIGLLDEPISFYEPDRYQAQLIWFAHGYVEYKFPNYVYEKDIPSSLQLSMEICSEAAPSADNWPSDISLDINGVRIGTWTSPADFGNKRGIHTPRWWPDGNSQYGQLKVWRVDQQGSFVDGLKVSSVLIKDLSIPAQPYITVRIGVDDSALHKGGMNIFGMGFGNHAQDIVMDIRY